MKQIIPRLALALLVASLALGAMFWVAFDQCFGVPEGSAACTTSTIAFYVVPVLAFIGTLLLTRKSQPASSISPQKANSSGTSTLFLIIAYLIAFQTAAGTITHVIGVIFAVLAFKYSEGNHVKQVLAVIVGLLMAWRFVYLLVR